MLTRESSIENFDSAMDELINSKYILADGKIGAVLKIVAQSRILYELFEYVTAGFDYQAAKSVCFVAGDGRGKFRLPQKDEDLLALCFLLLMEIDSGKEDVIAFCEKYFPSGEGMQKSYMEFAEQLLRPFKTVTEITVERIISADEKRGEEVETEALRPQTPVDQENNEQEAFPAVKASLAAATEEQKRRGGDDAEELVFILDQLCLAMKESDYPRITLAYTALKYAVRFIRRPKIDLKTIEKEIADL